MNPITAVTTALSVIAQAIADARAANDDAAVATLTALVADSAIGRDLLARADAAQGAIDRGRAEMVGEAERRERADTPVMGVRVVDVATLITAPLPE
jgi:hypothetical protein